ITSPNGTHSGFGRAWLLCRARAANGPGEPQGGLRAGGSFHQNRGPIFLEACRFWRPPRRSKLIDLGKPAPVIKAGSRFQPQLGVSKNDRFSEDNIGAATK